MSYTFMTLGICYLQGRSRERKPVLIDIGTVLLSNVKITNGIGTSSRLAFNLIKSFYLGNVLISLIFDEV